MSQISYWKCREMLCLDSKFLLNRSQGRAVGIGGARIPNYLHKYAVLLITKVCHLKKKYVCPPNL